HGRRRDRRRIGLENERRGRRFGGFLRGGRSGSGRGLGRLGELRGLVGGEPFLQRGLGAFGRGRGGRFGAGGDAFLGAAGTGCGFKDFVETAALGLHTPSLSWTTLIFPRDCML